MLGSQSSGAHRELYELVQAMPSEIRVHCVSRHLKTGAVLLRGGDKCDQVHILTDGMMQAVDESIYGVVYAFSSYHPYDIFGEMEVIGGFDSYRLTIRAIADSQVLTMPQSVFLGWMTADIHALHVISRILTIKLWEASQAGRNRMFASGLVQIMMFFWGDYESSPKPYVCSSTRQQIADETGLSVKTVNRSIKTLHEKDYLTVTRGHVFIGEAQFVRIRQYLSNRPD